MLAVQLRDERGVIRMEELIFEDFDEALEIVDHFCDQIIPLDWEDNF